MAGRNPMTVAGHRAVQQELQRLKGVERPKITRAIEEARAHGDLSENAEYHAAKEAQGLNEARIKDLEAKLSTAQVVDVSALSGDRVVFGATVKLSDFDTEESKIITIVGEDEADAAIGLISCNAPLARAIIGKQAGDMVTVKLPVGTKDYEVVEVSFGKG